MPVSVEPSARSDLRATAGVLGDAFLDDPVWTAIGPRRRAHRRVSNRLSFAGILAGSRAPRRADPGGARRRRASSARRSPSSPAAGRCPRARSSGSSAGSLVAGPLPASRGMRNDRAMRAQHPTYPTCICGSSASPRRITGPASAARCSPSSTPTSERLGVPTYLETGTPSNVAFYERGGYEVARRDRDAESARGCGGWSGRPDPRLPRAPLSAWMCAVSLRKFVIGTLAVVAASLAGLISAAPAPPRPPTAPTGRFSGRSRRWSTRRADRPA